MSVSGLSLVMVGVSVEELCCDYACLCASFLLFWISTLCVPLYVFYIGRAPAGLDLNGLLGWRTDAGIFCARSDACLFSQKLCGCCQQPTVRTVIITPLLLSASLKWLHHHLCWQVRDHVACQLLLVMWYMFLNLPHQFSLSCLLLLCFWRFAIYLATADSREFWWLWTDTLRCSTSGKGSCCLSVVAGCVVHVSQTPS